MKIRYAFVITLLLSLFGVIHAVGTATAAPNATSYTLTAPSPSTGLTNVASSNFTLTTNGPFTGTITVTPILPAAGENPLIELTPIDVVFSDETTKTFTFTPDIPGELSLTATNTGSLTDPAPVTYNARECLSNSPVTNTTAQNLTPTSETPASFTVTFTGVGGGCSLGNFKVITSNSSIPNADGYLDGTTTNIVPTAYPTGADGDFSSVSYTRTFTTSDVQTFFQYLFINSDGGITRTTAISIRPVGYVAPKRTTGGSGVTATLTKQEDYPWGFYRSTVAEFAAGDAFGDLTYRYQWFNCGARGTTGANRVLAVPSRAATQTECQTVGGNSTWIWENIYWGSSSDFTVPRPSNIANSVIVLRVTVLDLYGSSSNFWSNAVSTSPTYSAALSKSTTLVDGGEEITITGTGLTLASVRWMPNSGNQSWTTVTNTSSTELKFVVPASRPATTATIDVYTAGGILRLSNAMTLTRATVSTLTGLSLSSGTISFSSGTSTYSASVSGGTTSITVTPTFTGFGQTTTVNGTLVTSGAASDAINLSYGNNVISVIGTAENGSTTTYTVTVNRPTPPTLSTPTVTATATPANSNSISLSWGAISNRSTYTVKIYAVSSGNLLQTISSISSSMTTLDITTSNFADFITRTGYKFSVTAIGDGDNYFSSAESSLITAAGGSVSITSPSLVGGSAFEGRLISSATTVDVSDIPTGDGRTLTYEWFGGSDENNATSVRAASTNPTYTPKATDRSLTAQKYLAVRVVATIGVSTYSFISPAVPVYTLPNATGGSVTAPSPAARGTYTSGKYKVDQTVIGHPWKIMGTPWPILNYQWWICNSSAATAAPATSGCAEAPGDGNSGTASKEGEVNAFDLGNYGFSYVVPTEAAGKFLTFTATLTNEATSAQGTAFTLTQSRIQHSGIIQTTPGISSAPTISGTLRVAHTLTATSVTATTVNDNPTGKISYQWQRCTSTAAETCTNITGATRTTYKIVSADQSKYLRIVATARNNATTPDSTSVPSAITGVITS